MRSCGTSSSPKYADTKEETEIVPAAAVRERVDANTVVEYVSYQRKEYR